MPEARVGPPSSPPFRQAHPSPYKVRAAIDSFFQVDNQLLGMFVKSQSAVL